MKKNMGNADRIVRLLAAAAILILYFTHQISGTAAIVLGLVAAVFIVTGFISFCPLYSALGISTRKKTAKS